jgi:hypothetical protein
MSLRYGKPALPARSKSNGGARRIVAEILCADD